MRALLRLWERGCMSTTQQVDDRGTDEFVKMKGWAFTLNDQEGHQSRIKTTNMFLRLVHHRRLEKSAR